MSLRKRLKRWLYGSCPGLAGSFPYYGCKVFFPPRSLSFIAACDQGIFEEANTRLLQTLTRPGTWMFDVGTNIGLMSLPPLHSVRDCRVLSFEPSPNALPWLTRTIEGSPYRDRWTLIPKAVSSECGRVDFSVTEREWGMFDGIKSTNRANEDRRVEVEATTIDTEWERLGCPEVSMIKIDIEGGELGVLKGADRCLRNSRPNLLIEWNGENLRAYDCSPDVLVQVAGEVGYRVFAMPSLVSVTDSLDLRMQMLQTESFLLAPVSE